MSETTDACGDLYRLSLQEQRPVACDLDADHPGDEHRVRLAAGDVYWRKQKR